MGVLFAVCINANDELFVSYAQLVPLLPFDFSSPLFWLSAFHANHAT